MKEKKMNWSEKGVLDGLDISQEPAAWHNARVNAVVCPVITAAEVQGEGEGAIWCSSVHQKKPAAVRLL